MYGLTLRHLDVKCNKKKRYYIYEYFKFQKKIMKIKNRKSWYNN